MKFLVIIILAFYYRNWVGGNQLRDEIRVDGWFSWVSSRVNSENVRFVLSVIVPSILLLLISIEIRDWLLGLLWFLISAGLIAYSIEIVDTDIAFDDRILWLRNNAGEGETSENFESDITYFAFQSYAPVLFWFLILGPAGVLLVTLCQRYLDHHEEEAGNLADISQFWLEWLPVRINLFIFALVGDFGRAWQPLMDNLGDFESSSASVFHRATPSLVGDSDLTSGPEQHITELNNLKLLLDRAFWGWIGFAALLTVYGF